MAHMDLAEKLELVVIHYHGPFQNELQGLPKLCIPSFVLEDGAAGVAYHAKGVTQLPAPIGIGASFDPDLAKAYGRVEGEEARHKGIDVLQSPNLNLVRVPEDGRAFETYGEDPALAADLGVAAIDGIQSAGIVAEATHLGAYTEETNRSDLDEIVSPRAMQEVYLAPFRAAVEQGHVGSLMCAYGEVNGVRDCQDPALLGEPAGWGFSGLVRSDLSAVNDFAAAFDAGVDAVKPGEHTELRHLVTSGAIPEARLDAAVSAILSTAFAFGLILHPLHKQALVPVQTPADAAVSLRSAEESVVLLQNNGNVLPLSPRTTSLALIGSGAGPAAMSAGQGGAYVAPPFLSTPVQAIASTLGRAGAVRLVTGTSPVQPLPPIAPAQIRSRSVQLPAPSRHVLDALVSSGAVGTGNIPPADFSDLDRLSEVVVPPASGLYAISLTGEGDEWLDLDGTPLFADPGEHFESTWQVTAELRAGQAYTLSLSWFPQPLEGTPAIGWRDEDAEIAQAVAAARAAKVAVVVAEAPSGEGVDRPNLSLPGAQDQLIAAVAAANPRTVVVIDSGGAVLMPWLSSVAAVLEAWYPGEEDGTATAAVLFGSVDPAGHLPVTFPASGDGAPGAAPLSWPGVDDRVVFAEGLDVGYRYDAAEHLTPLFPFGFGLSYTTFHLGAASLHAAAGNGVEADVPVTNTGRRAGAEVVQAYLAFPAGAGEPPLQLAAFARVDLSPGQSATARLELPERAFEADPTGSSGGFRTVAGTYRLLIGTSSADLPLVATLRAP